MAGAEKRGVLKARAEALRRRTMDLVDLFTSPDVREHLELVALRIEEELEALAERGEALDSRRVSDFLPETTLCVMQLADLLRLAGPHARLPPNLKGRPDTRPGR